MEEEIIGMSNQEELQSQAVDITPLSDETPGNATEEHVENPPRKVRHHDHSVSRRYRMFSNYSSAGDMPHTRTSF